MSNAQVRGTKRSVRSSSVTAKPPKRTPAQPTPNETEAVRLQLLAEVGEVAEAPGQLDGLLDRAYLADSFFEENVLQDAACLRSPALFREAWAVAQALAEFYQSVGQSVAKEPVAVASAGKPAGANL